MVVRDKGKIVDDLAFVRDQLLLSDMISIGRSCEDIGIQVFRLFVA
jgi:hypothetical protein